MPLFLSQMKLLTIGDATQGLRICAFLTCNHQIALSEPVAEACNGWVGRILLNKFLVLQGCFVETPLLKLKVSELKHRHFVG